MTAIRNYQDYGLGGDDPEDEEDEAYRRRPSIWRFPRGTKFFFTVLGAGALIGLIISALAAAIENRPYGLPIMETGVRTGLTISFLFWTYIVFVEKSRFGQFLERRSFIVSAVVRATLFMLLILAGLIANNLIQGQLYGAPAWPDYYLDGGLLRDAAFSFAFTMAVIFVNDVASLVGPRVLTNIVLGRYHHPVREDRVFMFLDVRGATALAERIGDERAHEFLTRFFFDIDAILRRWNGEVVTYLGDGVMITWPLEEAMEESAPLEFLADVMGWVVTHAPAYQEEYGAIPTFRAGLHGGEVVVGECGSSKREIAYIGDVVNIAARLEQSCKRTRYVALASRDVVERMELPEGMVIDQLGPMRLRGRERQIDVVAIRMVRARH